LEFTSLDEAVSDGQERLGTNMSYWVDSTTVGSMFEVQYNTAMKEFRHRPLSTDLRCDPLDEPIFGNKPRRLQIVGEGEWIPGHPDDK
jgi:hypothetical protein